jgi:hypothetical protein
MASNRQTQEKRILNLLHSAWPGEVPAVALSQISLQFCARLFSLRRDRGWTITNRIERRPDGTKNSFYRLGSPPIPSNRERRAKQSGAPVDAALTRPGDLFELTEVHRDDG